MDYECGVTQPEMCEDVLGAGVIHPKGTDSSSKDCEFSSLLRYMDVSQPDLDRLRVRRPGRHRLDRRPREADAGDGQRDRPEAARPTTATPGSSASDAILVVTFITDEDDNQGDGSPAPSTAGRPR
jgi:hypothetical protein